MKTILGGISVVALVAALGMYNSDLTPGPDGGETHGRSQDSIEATNMEEAVNWMEQFFGPGTTPLITSMKNTGKLYIPAVGLKDALLESKTTPENVNPRGDDVQYGVHMAAVPLPNGTTAHLAAAYTELQLLNDTELIREVDARQWLEEALSYEDADGVVINPQTRFMTEKYDGVMMSANRYSVAEIIGYLASSPEHRAIPYHELANEAFNQKEYFKSIYYWGRSRRSPRQGDDWKKAEASKLQAYYALNFPGSRERARGELEWMIKSHPEENMTQLREEFAQ